MTKWRQYIGKISRQNMKVIFFLNSGKSQQFDLFWEPSSLLFLSHSRVPVLCFPLFQTSSKTSKIPFSLPSPMAFNFHLYPFNLLWISHIFFFTSHLLFFSLQFSWSLTLFPPRNRAMYSDWSALFRLTIGESEGKILLSLDSSLWTLDPLSILINPTLNSGWEPMIPDLPF